MKKMLIITTALLASLNANPADHAEKMLKDFTYIYGAKGTGNIFNNRKTKKSEIDCSGYVQRSYLEDGKIINNNRPLNTIGFTNSKQFKKITREELRRGDIIIWAMDDTEYVPQHVTIYTGNNHIISAESIQMNIIHVPCFDNIRPKIKVNNYTWYNRYNKKRAYMFLRWK